MDSTDESSTPEEGGRNQPITVDDSEESKAGTVSEDDAELMLQERERPSKSFGAFSLSLPSHP